MKKRNISRKLNQKPHPTLAAIGKQLQAARKAKGLSQRALGARAGLPQSHISQIENAGTDLRVTSLLALAHALDMELALVSRRLVPALEGLHRQTSQPNRNYNAADARQVPAYRLDEEEDDG